MAHSLYIHTGENNEVRLLTANDMATEYVRISAIIEDYYTENSERLGSVTYQDLATIVTKSITLGVHQNNLLYKIGKRNVLFVTNYDDSDWDSFTLEHEDVSNPIAHKANSFSLWSPIIDQIVNGECVVNFTSAFVDGDENIVKYIHEDYGVPATNCNKKYELGMTDWEIEPPTSKYDTVILAGIPNPSNEIHNIEDIKATFAPYCTDDFMLADDFEDEVTRLEMAKQWPNFDPDEVERIGSEIPERIRGDKLDFSEEFKVINTYSFWSGDSSLVDEATAAWARASEIYFKYMGNVHY